MKTAASSILTQDDILHLGQLARLELSPEEVGRFSGQLSSVVEYVEQIRQLSVEQAVQGKQDAAASVSHGVTGLQNVLAADQPREERDLCQVEPERILAEAPLYDGHYFTVRAVLGEENGGGA